MDNTPLEAALGRCKAIATRTGRRIKLEWACEVDGREQWRLTATGPTGHMWVAYGKTPAQCVDSFEARWEKARPKMEPRDWDTEKPVGSQHP